MARLVTLLKLLQLMKASLPISVVVHGISKDVSPALLNAFSPMAVTELGTKSAVSEEQSSNDLDPIVCREPGRTTLDKLVQPVKAQFSEMTDPGTSILVRPVQPKKVPINSLIDDESLAVFNPVHP